MQAVIFVSVAVVVIFTRGMVQRLLVLVGLIVASIFYGCWAMAWAWASRWTFRAWPARRSRGAGFRPAGVRRQCDAADRAVSIILLAKNLGHMAVTAITGRNLDQYIGRAFIGKGVVT